MPQADFYAGLPLAEQLQKLVDHHHDPAVRHISNAEAAILERAVARLRTGTPRAARSAEFEQAWSRLEHLYETTVWSDDAQFTLIAASRPRRGAPAPESASDLVPSEWVVAEAPATARLVQLALNVTFRFAVDPSSDPAQLWSAQVGRRSPPHDAALGDVGNELLNRALYQPTIAIEQSPPAFTSLAELLAKAAGPAWVALVAETTHDPVTVVVAGSVIVVLGVGRTVLGGAAEGLAEGLKERLYEWSRPKTAARRLSAGSGKVAKRRPKNRRAK